MFLRVGLLVASVVLMVSGLWAGVVRLGWALPAGGLAGLHGPLMVAAFFGTLIALERAVGLNKAWTYVGPVLMALGGLGFLAGLDLRWVQLVLTVGAAFYVAVAVYIYRLQPADFTLVMGLGALALFVGDVFWLRSAAPQVTSLWWMAFIVFIVAGERLELSRFVPKPAAALRGFIAVTLLTLLGLLLASAGLFHAERLVGLGFLLQGVWLLKFDIAWVNLKREGVHKFMGASLLTGYVWLLVGGFWMLAAGLPPAGPGYDGPLHAVFVGFTFAMVFGHAPVIFPAVLRLKIRFHPAMYLPLGLLHAALVARLLGDELLSSPLRLWGGMLSGIAVVIYFGLAMAVTLFGPDDETQ
ncbi:MAG TPA: hypothetical protein ENJ85_00755 [Oceanithermus profundus]|uniref:NnrS family protein n=1 Tax=Oceanithermus profundus TaxID=187137 RepID=A0A7C5SQ68_9DEIN|nr:hypothetical protein [Oceanithermus profundus]